MAAVPACFGIKTCGRSVKGPLINAILAALACKSGLVIAGEQATGVARGVFYAIGLQMRLQPAALFGRFGNAEGADLWAKGSKYA